MAQRKAVVFPHELCGFAIGWFVDHATEPYAIVWGNAKTRDGATAMLLKEYPDIAILHSDTSWPRIARGSAIRLMPVP